MKNYRRLFGITFGLLLVLAARAQPEKILEDYKPSIELSMQVMALLELEQTNEQPLTPEQATLLLPILEEFNTETTMTNEEAVVYSETLYNEILSNGQRDWVSQRATELFAENFSPKVRPAIGMGLGMRLMMGEQVNLVKEGLSKDALTELLNLIPQKAN
jgi:hypothetical protein